VRFVVNSVEVVDTTLNQQATQANQATQAKDANQQRVDAATVLYGDNAKQVLANIDTINACVANAKATCVVYVGGPNGSSTATTIQTPDNPVNATTVTTAVPANSGG
jgi:hypothetical protein